MNEMLKRITKIFKQTPPLKASKVEPIVPWPHAPALKQEEVIVVKNEPIREVAAAIIHDLRNEEYEYWSNILEDKRADNHLFHYYTVEYNRPTLRRYQLSIEEESNSVTFIDYSTYEFNEREKVEIIKAINNLGEFQAQKAEMEKAARELSTINKLFNIK